MRRIIRWIPVVGPAVAWLGRKVAGRGWASQSFPGSAAYWENRYAAGDRSGVGSYALFAAFKAQVLNDFVAAHGVQSVIDFGCGDGDQLRLAQYPAYLGFDISPTAVDRCRAQFGADPTKASRLSGEYAGETADLAISLDVIYHLVEDDVFERYMRTLFAASQKYASVFASNTDELESESPHVRHRTFTKWIDSCLPDRRLTECVPNRYPYYRTGSYADFFIFERRVPVGKVSPSATEPVAGTPEAVNVRT